MLASNRGGKDDRRRGECEPVTKLDTWTFNVCEADIFCYATPEQIHLWLPKEKRSGRTDRLVITSTNLDKPLELSWRASHSTMAWPVKRVPIASGVGYLLELKKEQVYFSKKIVLYQIPANLKTKSDQVDWMKQQGCSSQL